MAEIRELKINTIETKKMIQDYINEGVLDRCEGAILLCIENGSPRIYTTNMNGYEKIWLTGFAEYEMKKAYFGLEENTEKK